MTRAGRLQSETVAAFRSFARRRTAVFFTFFFPVLLIAVFAGLVGTRPTGGGLFAEPPAYYVPGYLAVVVLFTPLSRLGSTVARFREGNRFEKLATTPLTRGEWLLAHTAVTTGFVLAASVAILVALVLTGVGITPLEAAVVLVFVATAGGLLCGIGTVLGRLAGSQDGAIAMSNGLAVPLLLLSETFVTPSLLPAWFAPIVALSPVTYFARGVRATIAPDLAAGGSVAANFLVVAGLAVVVFLVGVRAVPWRS